MTTESKYNADVSTSELNVQEQQQVEKPSRRNFLKWGVVGGLLALPMGVSLYRKQFRDTNRVEFKCPSLDGVEYDAEYGGSWTPKQLKIPSKLGNVSIHSFDILPTGENHSFMLVFSTTGQKDKNVRYRIGVELHGQHDDILDYVTDSYMDTRVAAELSGRMSDLATLCLSMLPTQPSDVDKFVIFAYGI